MVFLRLTDIIFWRKQAITLTTLLLLQDPTAEAPFGGDLIDMLARTGGFALVILLILLGFSLLSWTIIIRKWSTLRSTRKANVDFVDFFRKSSRLSEIFADCESFTESPLSRVFSSGYNELNIQIQSLKDQNPDSPILTGKNIVGIQRALQRTTASELTILEKNMSWLATTGSVTPFIGLLGTVVGIINAFLGLSLERTTSIQAVAPGISEALIATAAGLFSAIPAVIAYNYFISIIKEIAAEMDDFSAEFQNLVERSFG